MFIITDSASEANALGGNIFHPLGQKGAFKIQFLSSRRHVHCKSHPTRWHKHKISRAYSPRDVCFQQQPEISLHDVTMYCNSRKQTTRSHSVTTNHPIIIVLKGKNPNETLRHRYTMSLPYDVARYPIIQTRSTCSNSVATIQLLSHAISLPTTTRRNI